MAYKSTVETTEEKTQEEKDLELIQKAKDCLESYQERESDNIRRAEEAIKFRAGEQWPDAIRREREDPNQDGGARPCPVLDKTDQYVRQIVNEERLNRAAIKIRPVDDYADPETAEIFTGIIRHIEDASEALVAYTTAGEHAIDGGFGYFRLLADYTDDMSFSQDIRIKRVHNRFSVAPGPHTESDGSDMKECVIWEDISKKDFKSQYPEAKEVGFEASDTWIEKDAIRVGEYYYIEQEPVTIHLVETGEVLTDEDYKRAVELATQEGIEPPQIKNTRESVRNQIKWCKITAAEVLDRKDVPGKYIPVIKVSGTELTMPDGKIRLSGAIEPGMDAQRLHNFSVAGYIEHVALAPRSPWIAEEGQVEGYEQDYADANRKPITLLKYASQALDGHLLPAPQRTPPAGIPPGWQGMLQNTEHGVEAAFGMYGPSVGATSQEKSGIALKEQKAQGAVGQFHFPDNLARSIQHCGRILIDWIPVYMDTAEIARVLGEDGEQKNVKLNPEMTQARAMEMDEFGKEIGPIYNLGVGKYDVTVSTGPSYTAKRQEAVDTQTQIISSAPNLLPVIGDILFENMDAPGSDKIAERLKAMLPPEIQRLESEENKDVDPKVLAAMAQIEQQSQMIEQKGQQLAEIEAQMQEKAQTINADESKVNSMLKEFDSQQKVFAARVQEQKANLELIGYKLVQQIEDVTGPIEQQLQQQTREVEVENEETGEPEKVIVQDPIMQEILLNLTEMSQESAKQMAEVVNAALLSINETMNQPRQTTLQVDENGNPIGSMSAPYGG